MGLLDNLVVGLLVLSFISMVVGFIWVLAGGDTNLPWLPWTLLFGGMIMAYGVNTLTSPF